MKRYIVDRIEGAYAVCERNDLRMIDIALEDLPEGLKEGDCLVFDGSMYYVDVRCTEERRRTIQEKIDAAFID